MQSTRRELLRSVTLFGGALLSTRLLAACAVDAASDEDTASEDNELVTCKPPVISANHGHTVIVPAADVTAGVTKTYSIRGAASHDHTITITAAQFAQLAKGGTVTALSTNGAGHTHSVQVSCAASAPPPPAKCGNGAVASTISQNHGHALSVSKADVAAGAAKTFSIKGSASHDHTITVSAAQFAQLKTGQAITVASSNVFAHVHSVTVTCV